MSFTLNVMPMNSSPGYFRRRVREKKIRSNSKERKCTSIKGCLSCCSFLNFLCCLFILDKKENITSIPRVGFTQLLPQAIELFNGTFGQSNITQLNELLKDFFPTVLLGNSSGGALGFEMN